MLKATVLVNRANRLRKQANLLLRKSKLLDLLGAYGEVSVTGSYRLNLMTTADLDIHVVNPKTRKALVREVLDKLIEQNFFDGYHFHDWVSHIRSGRRVFGDNIQKGYYIALKTIFQGKRWKIDIWFLNEPNRNVARLMKTLEDNMTDKMRFTILGLKQLRDKLNLDIASSLIYEGVVKKRISRLSDLLRFAGDQR
jgi:hypothetical protein